jgi:hypothetical protein
MHKIGCGIIRPGKMKERGLSQKYLNFKADQIDRYCHSCYHSLSPNNIEVTRRSIDRILTELEEAWQLVGIDASGDMDAFRRACNDCFESGRERPELELRFSCAIRSRLPEEEA